MRKTFEQNGIAESFNKTLKDMVKNMTSECNLPKYLLGEALQH